MTPLLPERHIWPAVERELSLMPLLVRLGVTPDNVATKGQLFKTVRVGAIFWCYKRWWSKCNTRAAVAADSIQEEKRNFLHRIRVRTLISTELFEPIELPMDDELRQIIEDMGL
jgi:hypothetical protein